jgi:hypothetical protein
MLPEISTNSTMLCYSTGSTVMVSKEENEILAGQK